MPSHPFDYKFQADVFSTPECTAIFAEKAKFQSWLDFEAALAESQAELGIIPNSAAIKIRAKAKVKFLNLDEVKEEYTKNRNSLVPILRSFRKICGKAGEYVHYGATTQDALDTAQVMAIRDTLLIVRRDTRRILDLLVNLAKKYRSQAMIGRSHSQQATPITFGLKIAVWLTEINRHIIRLDSLQNRVLLGQLSGAVGTMSALGEHGQEIARLTMSKLGLSASISPWHTARDNMAEVGCCLAMLCATAAKIANEIFQLGKSEILELRESAPSGKSAGSSTMPHKRNPVICERIAAINSHVRPLAGILLEGMIHENERDPRALWSEWLAMPQICIYSTAILNYLLEVIDNLEVLPGQMLKNLNLYGEMILSEWLMFKLAKAIGKLNAQEKLGSLIRQANNSDKTLKDLLAADTEISPHLSQEDLDNLDHPEKFVGISLQIVDDVLREIS